MDRQSAAFAPQQTRGPLPGVTADWRTRLAYTTDSMEVVEIARDFLGQWKPGQLGALPEACRPRAMASADDVTFYAFNLVRSQCFADHSEELEAMAGFFADASQRLTEIDAIAQGHRPRLFLTR